MLGEGVLVSSLALHQIPPLTPLSLSLNLGLLTPVPVFPKDLTLVMRWGDGKAGPSPGHGLLELVHSLKSLLFNRPLTPMSQAG